MGTNLSEENTIKTSRNRGEEFWDIRKIFDLLMRNWFLFAISLPLCLGSVYVYHRYTSPVYKASLTMLFKNNPEKSLSDIDLMEGFGLSPEVRNIENQFFIIRSQKIIRKAIDRLDFKVAYFSDGRFKDTELYHSAPFVLELDSIKPQMLNIPIHIDVGKNNKLIVSASADQGLLHNFFLGRNVGLVQPFNFEKKVSMGDWVEHPFFRFRIKPDSLRMVPSEGSYYVVFQSHEQLARLYRSKVSVTNYSEGSSIVFIGATGHNTLKTVRFLDVLSEVILENNLDRKNDMASRSIEFIQQQLINVADTLKGTQQQLMAFRKANRFMVPSEFASKLGEEYFEKEKELRLLEMRYSYYQTLKDKLLSGNMEKDYLLSAFAGDEADVVRNLASEYMTILTEKEMTDGVSGESNPYLAELERKLTLTRKTLLLALDKMMETVEIREQEVRDLTAGLSSRMDQLPQLEKHYLSLERDFKLNDAIYTFLLQKKSETQIAKASNVPDNEVLDQAAVNGIVSPDKKGDYSKAFLLALVIPAAVLGLREMLDNRIRSKRELQALASGVPYMGSIVRNKQPVENVIRERPNSLQSESFRSLRTKVRFLLVDNNHQVIVLTSSNMGEGKTFCALNLASVFAISGKKVALCGFDMRRPRLSEIFGAIKSVGISNYLIGHVPLSDIIYESGFENLYFVPAGAVPPNPSELIAGNKTNDLFKRLRKEFDVVIVDTPPVGLVADARLLMQFSDCQLFVVRSGVTLREQFTNTIGELINEHVSHLGLVLNDVPPSEHGYGYRNNGYYGKEDYEK